MDIGWTSEATNIDNTIEFYLSKKEKDDKIRELEIREVKEEYTKIPKIEKSYDKSAEKKELLVQEMSSAT